jgi:WD40 repeat protein
MSTLDRDRNLREAFIEQLLARWDEARERGEELDASTLCRDHPDLAEELARRIEALREWDRMDATENASSAASRAGPASPVVAPESAAIHLDLTDLRFHARGGLGVIFSARDDRLGRELAVKFASVPDAVIPEAEVNRRLLREVRVTAALEHPGIVPVYGLGQDARGRLCYAMRLIAGKTLGQAISEFHAGRRATPPRSRAELRRDVGFLSLIRRFRSACVTVAYAHSRGYLHRDLKPDHILLGDFDLTLVVDWGLTKPMDDAEATPRHPAWGASRDREPGTETGVGTLGFASPEQQAGDWPRVGPASDVFSLGAVLYVLLTKRLPFRASSAAEVIKLVEGGVLVAPRKRNPEIPRPLEAICLKALATVPVDRYPSAQALADDLERWLADAPVEAYPEPWAMRIGRTIDQHRLALLLVLAAAAGGLAAAAAGWHRGRLREVEVNTLAYATADRSAREQIFARQPGWAIEGLSQVARAGAIRTSIRSEPGLRSLAVACLGGIDLRPLGQLSSMPASCLAFSPEGRRLAAGELFGSGACRVQLIDVGSRRALWEQVIESPGPAEESAGVSAIAFSPDGRWLAAGLRDGRVLLWPVSGDRAERREILRHSLRVVGLGFSPDGNSLASASKDGQLALSEWRSEAGWAVTRRVRLAETLGDMAIAPDGGRVVCAGPRGVVTQELAPLRRPDYVHQLRPGREAWTDRVAISPDGLSLALPSNWFRTLAIGDEPSAEGMVDPDLGVAHQEETSHVEFSPDGSLVATGSADNTVKLWDVASRRMVLRQPVYSESLVVPVFDPEMRRLAVGSSEGVWLYEILGLEICRARAIGTWIVADFTFLPGGQPLESPEVVALRAVPGPSVDGEKNLELWAGPGMRPARSIPLEAPALRSGGQWALQASPADRRLALNLLPRLQLIDLTQTQARSNPLDVEPPVVASFASDGQSLWMVTPDNTVTSWSLGELAEKTRWKYEPPEEPRGRVGISCLDAGREHVVAGTLAGRVLVGTSAAGRLDRMTRASGPVQSLALSPDETLVACGTQRGSLELFRIQDASPLARRDGHAERIEQVVFHPSGRYLATLSRDRNLVLWQVSAGSVEEVLRITAPVRRAASTVHFSPDGRFLGVLIPGERAVHLWDLERLRRELAALGLDWVGAPFSATPLPAGASR